MKQVGRGRETHVGKMGKGVWHLAWSTRDTISACSGSVGLLQRQKGEIRNCLLRRTEAHDFYEPGTDEHDTCPGRGKSGATQKRR